MNYRQKLGYMAVGGVLMLIGMVAASIITPNLVAQKDVFGEITCTKLKVSDANGNPVVVLLAGERGGRVAVSDKSGHPGIALGIYENGGSIHIWNKSLKQVVGLIASDQGGKIAVFDNAQTPVVMIGVDEGKGRVDVAD